MFVDDVAYGWAVAVENSGERGLTVVGILFVLEKGSAVNISGSVSLGTGVLCWVAPLSEFGFQFFH